MDDSKKQSRVHKDFIILIISQYLSGYAGFSLSYSIGFHIWVSSASIHFTSLKLLKKVICLFA